MSLKTLQSRRPLQGLIKQREIELNCDISTGQYQSSSVFVCFFSFVVVNIIILNLATLRVKTL